MLSCRWKNGTLENLIMSLGSLESLFLLLLFRESLREQKNSHRKQTNYSDHVLEYKYQFHTQTTAESTGPIFKRT